LRGAARDLCSGSGLTANRTNLLNASELYLAFNWVSRSSRPALCYRPLLAFPSHFAMFRVTQLEPRTPLVVQLVLNLRAPLPDQLPACAGYKSCSFTFDQLRPPSASRSSGCACNQRPTCVSHRSFGGARGSTSNFPRSCIRRSTFRSASSLRRMLPPPISPSDQLPTLHRSIASSSCTFQLTCRLAPTCQPSGFAFRPAPGFHRNSNPPASPLD